jgi:hypothetical protein
MQNLIDNYVLSIQNHQYYEAHEFLEEWWFPKRHTKTPEVLFVKGLINCAVSFELHKKQRFTNANIVWQNYLKYKPLISDFESEYKDEYYKLITFVESIANEKGIS